MVSCEGDQIEKVCPKQNRRRSHLFIITSTSSVYHNPDVTLRDMERQIRDYESQLVLDQTSLTLLKLLVLEKSTHLSIIVSKLHPEITTAMVCKLVLSFTHSSNGEFQMVCDAQQLTQAMIDTRKYLANLVIISSFLFLYIFLYILCISSVRHVAKY